MWHGRHFNLTYCSLYDQGYTSLGTCRDTIPNPVLRKADGSGYHPAYLLSDWTLERAGRVAKKVSAPGSSELKYELKDFSQARRNVRPIRDLYYSVEENLLMDEVLASCR